MHRINYDPHNTPTLPLYPKVPKELPPASVFPSVPDTEPGTDEDDLFVTLKPQKNKKKTALLDM